MHRIKENIENIQLFLTSYTQVFLVCINQLCLIHKHYILFAITSFLISYMWVGNVRKVAINCESKRIIYSSGAMLGGITGILLYSLLGNFLKIYGI